MQYDALTVREFVDALEAGTAVPGGGSAAALSGALASALAAMVANLTASKEKFKNVREEMERVATDAETLKDRFLDLVQEDPEAYEGVLAAYRHPKSTEDEKNARCTAIRKSMKKAADVPLETLRASERAMDLALLALKDGNPNCLSDAWAAVHLARTAASVAAANVLVNLPGIEDEHTASRYRQEVGECLGRMDVRFEEAANTFEAGMP
jgi:formiminotetrahydrofolate cyclodeaminase